MNNLVLSQNPSKRASFITTKGEFINLEENRFLLIGYGSKDVFHSDLTNYLRKIGQSNVEERYIRLNDGTYITFNERAYIGLPKREPTKAQYTALLKWLDFISLHSKKRYLYVGANQYEFANRNNPDGTLPEDIIRDIKKNYSVIK